MYCFIADIACSLHSLFIISFWIAQLKSQWTNGASNAIIPFKLKWLPLPWEFSFEKWQNENLSSAIFLERNIPEWFVFTITFNVPRHCQIVDLNSFSENIFYGIIKRIWPLTLKKFKLKRFSSVKSYSTRHVSKTCILWTYCKEREKIYFHIYLILCQDSKDHFLAISSGIGLKRIAMVGPLVPILDKRIVCLS